MKNNLIYNKYRIYKSEKMSVEIPIETIKNVVSVLEQACLLYKKEYTIPDRCDEPLIEEQTDITLIPIKKEMKEEMNIEKAKELIKQNGFIIKEPKVKREPMTKEQIKAKALERYHNSDGTIRERQREYAIKRREKEYINKHGSLDGFNRKEYNTAYSKNRK